MPNKAKYLSLEEEKEDLKETWEMFYDDGEDKRIGILYGYLHQKVQQFHLENPTPTIQYFEHFFENYDFYEEVTQYAYYWLSGIYRHIKELNKSWVCYRKSKFNFYDDLLFFEKHVPEFNLNGEEYLRIGRAQKALTKYGEENKKEITDYLTIITRKFKEDHGFEVIKKPYKDFINKNIEDISDEYLFEKGYDEKLLNNMIFKGKAVRNGSYKSELCNGVAVRDNYPTVSIISPHPLIEKAFRYTIKKMIREAENTHREERNLPKVGEGWISETELFYYSIINIGDTVRIEK